MEIIDWEMVPSPGTQIMCQVMGVVCVKFTSVFFLSTEFRNSAKILNPYFQLEVCQNRPDDSIFTRPYNRTRVDPISKRIKTNVKSNVETRVDFEPT